MDLLLSKLDSLATRLSAVESEQKEHVHTLEYLSAEVADIKKEQQRLSQIAAKSQVSPTIQAPATVHTHDHDALQRCIELNGIPISDKEDLLKITEDICMQTNLSIRRSDVDTAWRTKDKKRVVIRFIQLHNRDTFFTGVKQAHLSTDKLGFEGSSKIFINEHLSYDQRRLFYLVRRAKIDQGFKYAWTSKQKIFMRKSDSSPALPITSSADLEAILSHT